MKKHIQKKPTPLRRPLRPIDLTYLRRLRAEKNLGLPAVVVVYRRVYDGKAAPRYILSVRRA